MDQNNIPEAAPSPTKLIRTPASPELLAQAFRYLAGAFLPYLILSLIILWLENSGTAPQLMPILQGVTFITAILLLITLYISARRLGFGKGLSIVALILAILFPLVALVLVISAGVRIMYHLRKSGWQMTWLGPKLPNSPS